MLAMRTTCPGYELSWVNLGYELSWAGVALGTSRLGYELSWVRVVMSTSRPGYELSWVRVVQIPVEFHPASMSEGLCTIVTTAVKRVLFAC